MNILFFQYLSQGVIMVFLYSITLYYDRNYFGLRNGDIIQLVYFWTVYLGCALVECTRSPIKVPEIRYNYVNKKPIWIFALVVVMYWLLNLDDLLLAIENPRLFYANMRIGGGIIYFIIIPLTMFLYFYYISKLNFSSGKCTKNYIKAIIATVLITLFIYQFGQKSSILTIGVLLLTTVYYKGSPKKRNGVLLIFGTIFAVAFVWIFILYTVQQDIKFTGILRNLAGYSDYLTNFNDLVDNLDHFTWGRTFFEDEIFAYIPRFLWPDKPVLYGSLKLGLEVPRLVDWTLSLTGAPSFGPIGSAYADFGVVGVLFHAMLQIVFFYIAKGYEVQIEKEYNFYAHMIFLAFSGMCVFSVTLTTIPIYQMAVVFVLYKLSAPKKLKGMLYNETSDKRKHIVG